MTATPATTGIAPVFVSVSGPSWPRTRRQSEEDSMGPAAPGRAHGTEEWDGTRPAGGGSPCAGGPCAGVPALGLPVADAAVIGECAAAYPGIR